MIVCFYFDVYPGITAEHVYPSRAPLLEKPAYATRYKVEVEIPDPNEIDHTLRVTPTVESPATKATP